MHLNKSKIVTSLAATALGVGLVTSAVAGANLVKNGTFNKNLHNWTSLSDYTELAVDAGRLKITSVDPGVDGNWASVRQCVTNVVPGATYVLEADSLVPSFQYREGKTFVRLHLMTGDNCDLGTHLETYNSPANTLVGSSQHHSVQGLALPGTNSVMVEVVSQEDLEADIFDQVVHPGADFTAFFDNVTLSKLGGGKPAK